MKGKMVNSPKFEFMHFYFFIQYPIFDIFAPLCDCVLVFLSFD